MGDWTATVDDQRIECEHHTKKRREGFVCRWAGMLNLFFYSAANSVLTSRMYGVFISVRNMLMYWIGGVDASAGNHSHRGSGGV